MRLEDIEQYEETQQSLYLAVIGIELLLHNVRLFKGHIWQAILPYYFLFKQAVFDNKTGIIESEGVDSKIFTQQCNFHL